MLCQHRQSGFRTPAFGSIKETLDAILDKKLVTEFMMAVLATGQDGLIGGKMTPVHVHEKADGYEPDAQTVALRK